MTVQEFISDQNDALNKLISDSDILNSVGFDVHAKVVKRIFTDKENANGDGILSARPYSTKPAYFSREVVGLTVGTFIGKKGRVVKKSKTAINAGAKKIEIKSAYFPGGYAEMKSQLGKGALELNGLLMKDFANPFFEIDGTALKVKFKSKLQNDIAVGNEDLRGAIFAFKDSEINEFERLYTMKLIEKGLI